MIPLPSKPKITEKKDNYALFELDGFYPGYGSTVGNALRRVLLSSLEGAAITRVKIKNVNHEFTAIPGVMEDSLNLILNLKQIRLKMFCDEPQIVTLKVKGEKEVKAKDIKLNSELELITPDAHIATLTEKAAELEMELTIEKGVGYEPVERRKKEKLGIGEIMVDAIFNPVRKVSLNVENTRVGDRTDFDKIILGIETDGTITPEEAYKKAIEIISTFFATIGETEEIKSK
ncbi:MAG TPA: DNA-directed RNA polymerase subunit alpha [Candidatus Pacearchaeota archaeon]|nr:DNA-directed RNA polymerase subunit alpha [Candidatus Pacearchaeota archaeon]